MDITVRGLDIVKNKCEHIFLEAYTSVLSESAQQIQVDRLQEMYGGKKVVVADRTMCENDADDVIIAPAKDSNVAFLVVGDPVCATTHTDLVLRAKQAGVDVELIHNASIMGAVGTCGLQLYNFGHTVSIPFFDDKWRPISFYPKIKYNRRGGMHTLCLLDIKVKEPDFNAMMKGQTKFLPPRYMSVNVAAEQLLEAAETKRKELFEKQNGGKDEDGINDAVNAVYDGDKTLCVGLARMGQSTQRIAAGTLKELTAVDFGGPLHSLIICGTLHDLEMEVLKEYVVEGSSFDIGQHKEVELP
jgi:diphthine synthase